MFGINLSPINNSSVMSQVPNLFGQINNSQLTSIFDINKDGQVNKDDLFSFIEKIENELKNFFNQNGVTNSPTGTNSSGLAPASSNTSNNNLFAPAQNINKQTANKQPISPDDLNKDGRVDARDTQLKEAKDKGDNKKYYELLLNDFDEILKKYLTGELNDDQLKLYDMNNDGIIEEADRLIMMEKTR